MEKSIDYVANTHRLAKIIALDFLEDLNVHDFIGPTLSSLTSLKNIRMIYKPLNDPQAKGFCAIGKGQKFLYVNTNFNSRLQNFTIVHELWHIHLNEFPNVFNFEEIDEERAADHFAANILLPVKTVLNKYHNLKQNGKSSCEILFIIADLSASPYEAVLKRFSELKIDTKEIYEKLDEIKITNEDPYLTDVEFNLQQLRSKLALAESSLDMVKKIAKFPELDSLKVYFKGENSEEDRNE